LNQAHINWRNQILKGTRMTTPYAVWLKDKYEAQSARSAGRPTVMTTDNVRRILDAVSLGATDSVCANLIGISKQTIKNWRVTGRNDIEAGNTDTDFALFVRAWDLAKGEAAQKHLRTIDRASAKDWRAAVWFLERLYPDDFQKAVAQTNINVSANAGAQVIDIQGDAYAEALNSIAEVVANVRVETADESGRIMEHSLDTDGDTDTKE
jgi:hypothetical protein